MKLDWTYLSEDFKPCWELVESHMFTLFILQIKLKKELSEEDRNKILELKSKVEAHIEECVEIAVNYKQESK